MEKALYGKASYGSEDCIAALATPPGESALAVIRTSGAESLALLAKCFSRPEKLLAAPGNTVVHGWISAAGRRIDDVLVSVYRAPHSFTGEEGADITCHGGASAPRAVMAALEAAGFREALRGEFSFRAFRNGKIDLTRAESIMEIVAAKTDPARGRAVERLSGVLEKEIRQIQTALVAILAETELFLDYPEEETGFAAKDGESFPGAAEAQTILPRLRALSAAWERERLYRDGALAVIAGRPNAGKSSLFNLLLREERSIVTDIPGTTRDWIEAWLSIEGIPVRLADTAGLREPENGAIYESGAGGSPPGTRSARCGFPPAADGAADEADEIEKIGIERSRELIAKADIVLYVIDGAAGLTGEDRAFLQDPAGAGAAAVIPVWNKADLAPPAAAGPAPDAARAFAVTSAQTGAGLDALCRRIASLLGARESGDGARAPGTGPGTERQKICIDTARAALEEALALAEKGAPLDIVAPCLRAAVNALGEITGDVSTADILETIFSTFCVGK